MTNDEVQVFAKRFYDLKCSYYGVLFRERSTKLDFENYEKDNSSANTIAELMTSGIFHSVETLEQRTMREMFNEIEQRAIDFERKERKQEYSRHYLGELDDILKKHGFME